MNEWMAVSCASTLLYSILLFETDEAVLSVCSPGMGVSGASQPKATEATLLPPAGLAVAASVLAVVAAVVTAVAVLAVLAPAQVVAAGCAGGA
jgi:hypothetical protein